MVLQQTITPIVRDPRQYITMLYGRAGVGKTTFGSQVPGHYFIKTEEGTAGVETFGEVVITWEDVLKVLTEIITEKEANWLDKDGNPLREVKTVVFDTGDMLAELASAWVCKNISFPEKGIKQKFERIEDVPFGRGYKAVARVVVNMITKLRLYGLGVMVLCHAKEFTKQWRGQDFTAYRPNFAPSLVEQLLGACDCVGYIAAEENYQKDSDGKVVKISGAHSVHWQSHFLYEAKHRLKGFPESLEIGIDNGYDVYVRAFKETIEKFSGIEVPVNQESIISIVQ
jgi:hypothetical protein